MALNQPANEQSFGSGLWKLSKSQKAMAEMMNNTAERNAAPFDFDNQEELRAKCKKFGVESAEGFAQSMPPINTDDGVTKLEISVEDEEELTCGVTIYAPAERTGPLPGLVRIHGGGMAYWDGREIFFELGDRVTAKEGLVVCCVHFTNSTEAPFPRGLNDCINAVKWFNKQKERFNLIRNKGVALFGESGGGNLVISTGMSLRNTDLISCIYASAPYTYGLPDCLERPDICGSMIEYFPEDPELHQNYKNIGFGGAWLYTPKGSGNEENPLAWPYFATNDDLVGMAPTMIECDECDCIADQGKVLYRALQNADVPSWYFQWGGMTHCHMGEMFVWEMELASRMQFIKIHTRDTPAPAEASN